MKLSDWKREPLVHFLVGGVLLFAFFAWQGEELDPSSRTISVSQEDRARLALQWERTLKRPPTDAELDSLTRQYVREEVLYREALRLGLDRDDAVVRKRMATKMDYLAASMAETARPSDATLSAWLKQHSARFTSDSTASFEQLYYAEKSAAQAALKQAQITGGQPQSTSAIDLPATLEKARRPAIEARFGRAFAEAFDSVDGDGRWSGPVPSGFGWHLVRVTGRSRGTVPPLSDIRQRVENDWRSQTMAQRREDAYQVLREVYNVSVDR